MKLINTHKKLFGEFPVLINAEGELILKADSLFSFHFCSPLEFDYSLIKSITGNQHGTFIKLNKTVRTPQKYKTVFSFLGMKLLQGKKWTVMTGGKTGMHALLNEASSPERVSSHWRGYVSNNFPAFASV